MTQTLTTIAVLLLSATTMAANATGPIANTGRLTCTVEPLPAETIAAARDMSCRYEPFGGAPSSYTGKIKRLEGPALNEQTLVFAWDVFAPGADVAPHSLNGTYLSSLSAAPAPSTIKISSLRRESPTPIELRAVGPTGTAEPNTTLVMELELRSTRA